MSARAAKVVFVLVLAINCVLWSQSRFAENAAHSGHALPGLLGRRGQGFLEVECKPSKVSPRNQCTHAQDVCPGSDTVLGIPYTQLYFCTSPSLRPLTFAGLVVWLIFVFSTLGIAASDFFCPNLGTIADVFGLDENVAGVTFLAFGNGSPDMFSTFAAMRAHTASLALGELLGAATFISSVVVGSICLIKPFKVDPYTFLRDVGFFSAAVALLQATLWDGRLYLWETLSMIGLYLFYVLVVVCGTWWRSRRERRRMTVATIRTEFVDDEIPPIVTDDEPYHDDPSSSELLTPHLPPPDGAPAVSIPSPRAQRAELSRLELPPRAASNSPSAARSPLAGALSPFAGALQPHAGALSPHAGALSPPALSGHMASFSLVGALEFRQFVQGLQPHASGSSLGIFDTPYAGGHYSRRTSRGRTPASRGGGGAAERDPWDAALRDVPLDARRAPDNVLSRSHVVRSPQPMSAADADGEAGSRVPSMQRHWPTIDEEDGTRPRMTRAQYAGHALRRTYEILFPTLHDFRAKSVASKLVSLFATPAVLALTLTLPVVVTPYGDMHSQREKTPRSTGVTPGALIEFEDEEEDVERAMAAEEEVVEEMHDHLRFNKWLMATQCILAPIFCSKVLFDDTEHEFMLELTAGLAGLTLAILVAVFGDIGDNPPARLARCIMGFLVAMVWIMAIADEVVNILQTFGIVFGLSPAIIGLTIFAAGASLADLVANTTVAAFAPLMGFAACFGGPMLNMLLGVGVSGALIIYQNDAPYDLEFSTTLIISSIGLQVVLLVTAIVVPLNGFHLTRKWGICLIMGYLTILVVNVVVELTTRK